MDSADADQGAEKMAESDGSMGEGEQAWPVQAAGGPLWATSGSTYEIPCMYL